jgi:hypothetical protein
MLGLPLAGALRIRRGGRVPHITTLTGAEAVFALRESLECGDVSPRTEGGWLDRMTALAAAIPVGAAHTVLGHGWDGALARWLGAEDA